MRRVRVRAHTAAEAQPAVPLPPNHEDAGSADEFARRLRSLWVRLIKKVYEADPLVCPFCLGPLKILSLIGDGAVFEKILRRLKLWDRPERPPPAARDRSIRYDADIPRFEDIRRWSDAAE